MYSKKYMEEFKKICNDNDWYPVGYLPWKLMKTNVLIQEKEPNWEEKIRDPINDTLKILDEIINEVDPFAEYEKKYYIIEYETDYYTDMHNMMIT